jgi:hypothetical protein
MSEPIRHSASVRNDRKFYHHAKNLREQVERGILINLQERERLLRMLNLVIKLENRSRAK